LKFSGDCILGKTHAELFIERLAAMPSAKTTGVTTKSLREKFKWPDKKFNDMRERLIKEGKIKKGAGHAGKTILVDDSAATATTIKKPKIFISYSHKDKDLKLDLEKHLKPLERMGIIDKWSDKEIDAGSDFAKEVDKNLADADLVLLLISIDFVNSEYCYEKEMTAALVRHSDKTAKVIPVILRPCMWHDLPFGKLLALPTDGTSVQSHKNPEDAYLEIAKTLKLQAQLFIAQGGWSPKQNP
jgi:hypothetical protein